MAPKKRKSEGDTETKQKKQKVVPEIKSQRILEKGHLYFFYRPKLEHKDVTGPDDVQRLFVVMAPFGEGKEGKVPANQVDHRHEVAHGAARYRMCILPGKTMPFGKRQTFLIVEAVVDSLDALHELLGPKHYTTKTRGERDLEPLRAVGVAHYELIWSENQQPSKSTSHLAYILEEPKEPGPVQSAFHILKEARHVVTVKNPQADQTSRKTERQVGSSKKADFPKELQQKFHGIRTTSKKTTPVNPPDFLDHANCEIIFVSTKQDLTKFGEVGRKMEAEEKQDEASAAKSHKSEMYTELQLTKKDNPNAEKRFV